MKISQKSLIKGMISIYVYVFIVTVFSLLKFINLNNDNFDLVFFLLINILLFNIFLFIKKFLKRYYNYRDKNNIIISSALFVIIQNIMIYLHGESIRHSKDIKFIFYLTFIIISLLIIIFYTSLFYQLIKISFRHFKLMKWIAWSFFGIAIILAVTGTFDIFNDKELSVSIENAYPYITVNLLSIIPFLMLAVIYRKALMEGY